MESRQSESPRGWPRREHLSQCLRLSIKFPIGLPGIIRDQTALANLGKNGQPELVVLRVDHPTPGPSRGFYRIAARLTPYRQIGSTQRLVDVPFTTTPPDALNAMIPNDRNLAPPG